MSNPFVAKLSKLVKLDEAEVSAITVLTGRSRKRAAKKDLIREGDQPGPLLIMLDGWACRYKVLPNGTRQIMALMLPGDACDLHISMLAEMDHGIQTITAATVASISGGDMHAMMDAFPKIARAMYVAQLVDEGIMRAWIVSMGRRSSIERVAHLACELYVRMSNIGLDTEGKFSLPLSQIVLADALGMTPVHINRVLRQLREAGAMALGRGQLEILDPLKLVHMAGFDENYLHRRLQGRAQIALAG